MKKILIISPHFPPSNLTAVHRARFIANHLPEFGWEPIILTVHEKYYEELLDFNLEKLLPPGLRVEKVNAIQVGKPRLIGDIGLRAFFSLYRKAKQLVLSEKIDFVYITIPSFYGALWGRRLHESTGVKYGIDYIDPWVHEFPGSDKFFSRHWLATKLAKFLEPIAVKKAVLITGVAASYYHDVIVRNPALKQHCVFAAIPYGSEAADHAALKEMQSEPYLFKIVPGVFQLIYAGAMLPKAYVLLEAIFKAISKNSAAYKAVEFHFVGTGKTANDAAGFNINPLAAKYGLWQSMVFEYPKRIPYLDVLVHLHAAGGIFILGSTEPHYTPSKVYQAVLSQKPIFAVLHTDSTAVEVIKASHAGLVLSFSGDEEVKKLDENFGKSWAEYKAFASGFSTQQVDHRFFELYSARHITGSLVKILDSL